eukprot:sb/3476738/
MNGGFKEVVLQMGKYSEILAKLHATTKQQLDNLQKSGQTAVTGLLLGQRLIINAAQTVHSAPKDLEAKGSQADFDLGFPPYEISTLMSTVRDRLLHPKPTKSRPPSYCYSNRCD